MKGSGDQELEDLDRVVVQPLTARPWVLTAALGMVLSLETIFFLKSIFKKITSQFCGISTKTFQGLRL